MKNIKRLKKRPFKVEVYWDENHKSGDYMPELYVNGELPAIQCPKCKTELYAGGPDSMKVFPCGCCGKILKVGWSILNEN